MKKLLEKLEKPSDSHKGDNGYVGVIAGSVEYTGAPALVAEAALRSGCDLTKILTSGKSRDIVASFSENLIVDSYEAGYFDRNSLEGAKELESWSDVIVIGPGLGDANEKALKNFVSGCEKPLVIDADAIEPALDTDISDAVFTPHKGEAEAIEEKFGSIGEFVEETGNIVVLKGEIDKIYAEDSSFENETGTAAMTVGGTGDVLAGIIGSLLSQGLEPVEAARLGCWINGKAGEKAEKEFGNSLLATDLIEILPRIIQG